MKYMMMIHLDDAPFASASEAEERADMIAPFMAFNEALTRAHAMVSAERLLPATAATIVRVGDGGTTVTGGPFTQAGEQMTGFYIIEAATPEEAIGWAARCPGARHGAVELRPVWAMG